MLPACCHLRRGKGWASLLPPPTLLSDPLVLGRSRRKETWGCGDFHVEGEAGVLPEECHDEPCALEGEGYKLWAAVMHRWGSC